MQVRHIVITIFLLLGAASVAHAAYIQRTITVDGDVSDWSSPTDITNNTNPYQFSTDGQDGNIPKDDLDDPIGQTGRDLKKFAFTWDANYIYFYVERWASTNNTVHWFFYLDTNADGYMNSGEKVFDVSWQGNTGDTDATLYDYVESASGPDLIGGDGATLPGSLSSTSTSIYTNVKGGVTSGTGDGVQMESRISWAALGFSGPVTLKFHISSSNNTNLPGGVLDNMDGPAGGQLFPKDLQISKSASLLSVKGNNNFTYTVSVFNASIESMTSVTITDTLPAQVQYVSFTADSGSYDSATGVWSIASIPANSTYNLTITVKAGVVPVAIAVDNTATLTTSTPADEDSSNDSATATVTIQPIPLLTIVKYASSATVNPGGVITYTLDITNTGGADGYSVVIDDQLSSYVALKINKNAGTPFLLTDNPTNPSGLTINNMTYSADYGTDGYTHPLTDRGDGYDNNVTNFKIEMNNQINNSGGNFTIQYDVIVK